MPAPHPAPAASAAACPAADAKDPRTVTDAPTPDVPPAGIVAEELHVIGEADGTLHAAHSRIRGPRHVGSLRGTSCDLRADAVDSRTNANPFIRIDATWVLAASTPLSE